MRREEGKYQRTRMKKGKSGGKKLKVCVREKERRSWIGGLGGGADCICEIVYVRKI